MVASFPGSPKCEHCLAPQLFKLFWPPGYAYVQLNPLYPHVVHVLRKDTRLSPPSWLPCLRSGAVKPGNETWEREWKKCCVLSEMVCFCSIPGNTLQLLERGKVRAGGGDWDDQRTLSTDAPDGATLFIWDQTTHLPCCSAFCAG